jgi:peptidoglycan/xylan/chitin deacetylase (PgdA/CDA1 family)
MTLTLNFIIGLFTTTATLADGFYPPLLFTATKNVTLKLANATGEPAVACGGEPLPFCLVTRRKNEIIIRLPRLPNVAGDLRVDFSGQSPRFIPLVDSVNVALSFDDGPAQGSCPDGEKVCPRTYDASPTLAVVDALQNFRHGADDAKIGVAAIFFALTSPDTFLRDTFTKGETAAGGEILREIDRRGHLLGVHWGGGYRKQTTTHPRHAVLPAPNIWQNSLLETELQECADRLEKLTGKRPRYVRPPLWKYEIDGVSALPDYRRLGLKMILTDARYPDGGYHIISAWIPRKKQIFIGYLRRAFASGKRDLVVSMHDANTQTASALPRVLQTIKDTFAAFDWGVADKRQINGRLRFAETPAEVARILDEWNH